jgi:hypothetical protein
MNGAVFHLNREDIVSTQHNRKSVREENVMNGSHLDISNTPIRPNWQPLERQAALPNCDIAPFTDGRPKRNVKLPAQLQDYVLEDS